MFGSRGPSTMSRQERIPQSLQAVFLASNRGKEVNKPPPERVADKVFFRNWRFQRKVNSSRNKAGSLFGDSKEKMKSLEKLHPKPREAGTKTKRVDIKPAEAEKKILSPQQVLDSLIANRGYSTDTYKTLSTAYHNAPTDLQKASYGAALIRLVRTDDVEGLREMLGAGLSPNPCNQFGESLVHMVCRRGSSELLEALIEFGCNWQVADDYGRTVLHDACWASNPAFQVVKLILEHDTRLFYMMDTRGSLPLSYVHKDHWAEWNEFLVSIMNDYFPILNEPQGPPELAKIGPNSRPLPDPKNALPVEVAVLLAQGKATPVEAVVMAEAFDEAATDETYEESDSEYDSDEDSEYDEDEDDDEDLESGDMYEVIQMAQSRRG